MAFACQATIISAISDVSTTVHGEIFESASTDCEFSLHSYPDINQRMGGSVARNSALTPVEHRKNIVFSFGRVAHENNAQKTEEGAHNPHSDIFGENKNNPREDYLFFPEFYVPITSFVSTTMPRCRIG